VGPVGARRPPRSHARVLQRHLGVPPPPTARRTSPATRHRSARPILRCKGWAGGHPPCLPRTWPRRLRHLSPDDYQHLVDHPVEMGTFDVVEFTAANVPQPWRSRAGALSTRSARPRTSRSVRRAHAAMFHATTLPTAAARPSSATCFLTTALARLPAASSTRTAPRSSAARRSAQAGGARQRGQGARRRLPRLPRARLARYFHLWNVKRISPRPFTLVSLDRRELHCGCCGRWRASRRTTTTSPPCAPASSPRIESWDELLGRTATRC